MKKLSALVSIAFCLLLPVLSSGRASEVMVRDAPSAERVQSVLGDGPTRPLDSLLMLPRLPYRFRAPISVPAEPRPAAGLDSALAALARMLTDSTHGESLPRLAVTPFEELNGSVSDTGVYMAAVLESELAGSGRCRVIEQLSGIERRLRPAPGLVTGAMHQDRLDFRAGSQRSDGLGQPGAYQRSSVPLE